MLQLRYVFVVLATATLGLVVLVAALAMGDDPQVLEPPTAERPVVVCGKESGEQYPFATTAAGARIPISHEECNQWSGIDLGPME